MKASRTGLVLLAATLLAGAGCTGGTSAKGPTPGAIGSACTSASDCHNGLACDRSVPGGYCVAQCSSGSCPSGSTCGDLGGQKLCLASCASASDCRKGQTCKGGVCQPPCSVDADCGKGQSCQGGVCMSNGIGAACTSPGECASGECAESLPGGYCTTGCGSGKPSCPTGTTCVTYSGGSYCFDGCQTTADCRTGYVCSNGVCDVACASNSDCGGGEICQNQACTGAGVGESCAKNADCPSGLTCDTSVSGGYCTTACGTSGSCPVGAICGTLEGQKTCTADCRTDADCATGQKCVVGACIVPCKTDSDCGANAYCDATTGQCHQKAVGSGNVVIVDLGTVPVNQAQSFQVDGKTFGVEIVAVGGASGNYMIGSVKNPSGTELVNQSNYYAGPLRVVPDTEVATAEIPNSDSSAVALTPGVWHFTVITDKSSNPNPHVTLLYRKSPTGAEQGGTENLNVFLAPNAFGTTTAANAAQDANLQAVLARWNVFYGNQASVPLGTVHYYDISSQYSDITTTSQYESMFDQYGRGDGLNLFFVRSLSIGGQSAVAGVAGGIPGPARVPNTLHSGVVIERQTGNLGNRLTGDDMSHECGHFHGLFHTTEFPIGGQPPIQDLISDTPECQQMPTPPSPSNPNGTAGNCPADAYKNLMFPALTGEQSILTPGQALVVKANPGIN